MITPAPDPDASDRERLRGLCSALLSVCEGGSRLHPRLPCCLHASPSPHEWPRRWADLVERVGVTAEPQVALVGEALQVLATMPRIQAEFAAGDVAQAQGTILRFLAGFVEEEPAQVLERDA